MFIFLELVNEEEDKNDELVAQNLMLAAIIEKTLEEDELWGRYNVSYLIHWNPQLELSGNKSYKWIYLVMK